MWKEVEIKKKKKKKGMSQNSKTKLEQYHKNLYKEVDGWLSNTGSTSNARKTTLIGVGYCVVMVTILSVGEGWRQKVRTAEKIGGKELKLSRGRPAVPKAYVRELINLRKTFSLTHGKIGWGKAKSKLKQIIRLY